MTIQLRTALCVGAAVVVLSWSAKEAWAAPGGQTDAGTGDTGGISAKKATAASDLASSDLGVVQALHANNVAEMQVGKMAKDRAESDAVKSFANKVASDHAMEDKRIAAFLKAHGKRLSSFGPVSNQVPVAHTAYKDKTGAAYDHAFLSQMSEDYEKTIAQVENARKETTDDSLRALLKHLLPTLRVLQATAKVLSDPDNS